MKYVWTWNIYLPNERVQIENKTKSQRTIYSWLFRFRALHTHKPCKYSFNWAILVCGWYMGLVCLTMPFSGAIMILMSVFVGMRVCVEQKTEVLCTNKLTWLMTDRNVVYKAQCIFYFRLVCEAQLHPKPVKSTKDRTTAQIYVAHGRYNTKNMHILLDELRKRN